MLGRGVAERLTGEPRAALVAPEVAECIASADAFVLNLECCISDRGNPFPDPDKSFFFRAPPIAAQRLAELGVDAVTLANNHALDYGPDALLDTLTYLRATGIAAVGAGADLDTARAPVILRCGGLRIRLVGFSDHPADYAAGPERPGIAFAPLRRGPPDWVLAAIKPGPNTHLTLATPHWGSNMVPGPQPHVRRAAGALLDAGANLVAGHSAHVFHGIAPGVIFDLGDFIDDYLVHPKLRNDLGLLWLVELDAHGPRAIRALPLALDYCFTRRASPAETDIIAGLLQDRCTPFGTEPRIRNGMIELNTDRATKST
jgi:Bacterial capsule synthesis protein PGA_cap